MFNNTYIYIIKIKNLILKYPFIFLYLLIFIHHCLSGIESDDKVLLEDLGAFSFGDSLAKIGDWINSATSRIFIIAIQIFLVQFPLIWKIADPLLYVLLAYSITYLLYQNYFFNNNIVIKQDIKIIVVFSILTYTLHDLSSAGWMTTSVHYFWPLAFGIYVLTPLSDVFRGKGVQSRTAILTALAALYASNFELMAPVLLSAYLGALFYVIYSKKYKYILYILFILFIILFNIYLIASNPGNYNRQAIEIAARFPDMNLLSFIDKINIGYSRLFSLLTIHFSVIIPLLSLSLLIFAKISFKNFWLRFIGMMPAIIYVSLFLLIFLIFIYSKNLYYIYSSIYKGLNGFRYGLFDLMIFEYKYISLVNFFLIGLFFFSVILALSVLYREDKLKVLVLSGIVAAGAGSAVAMGLSATIWISHWRTAVFFYFALAIVMMQTLVDIKKIQPNSIIFKFLYILGSCNYIREILFAL